MVLAPDCSFWTESMSVVLGVVIEADIPTDDEEVVLRLRPRGVSFLFSFAFRFVFYVSGDSLHF